MDEISLGSYEDAPRSLRDLMRKYSNTPQQGTDVLGLLKRVYGEGASNLESVLRGSAAAIPGFAGDIGQGFDIRGLRSLPTTEQILSKIPRATRPTKEGAGFEEVGTYLPLPISPGAVKQGAQAVQRGMKAAAPYAARSAVNLAEKYGVAPTMSVVKPKGGNWLAGHVEGATKPLLSPIVAAESPAMRIPRYEALLNEPGLTDWNRQFVEHNLNVSRSEAAVDNWINTKLNKYIRNEMATPEDPVRALAERGILHVDPQQLNYRLDAYGKYPSPGQEFLAKSDAAKVWEGVTDNSIASSQAGEWKGYPPSVERNPWLETVPPETKVYGTLDAETFPTDLGFDHLLDELRAAVDPASTLPQHLRYSIKDLEKVTVPQAVERVSQINAWRAKEAARAEKEGMMANLQAQPRLADENLQLSFVEKPGGTWVDIPETIDEKGMKLCSSIGRAGGWCTQHDWAAKDYGSGVNRLTALVDAEGRPHAQAKITQIGGTDDAMEDVDGLMQVLTASERKKFNNFLGSDEFYGEFEEAVDWLRENMPKAYAKVIESRKSTPPDITELKPVGNSFKSERAQEYAKRDPNYAMKVEQSVLRFLNSGNWGNVKDLHHYDIVDMKSSSSVMDALQSLYGDESGRDILKTYAPALNAAVDATPDAPRFMTLRQLRDFIGPVESTSGFAAGGLVAYDPDEISRIAEEAVQGFAGGGKVEDNPFKGLEATLGSKAGAYLSDKTTEGLLWLYDKLSDRDKLSTSHKILLDTFVNDKRDPITAKDFRERELVELQNLIRQKEKLSGNKGSGNIQYKDYDTLPGGDQRRAAQSQLVAGNLPPRTALSTSLGQFNYKLDPKTGRYMIIDEYDFNPQKVTHMGKTYDVPLEHYGDYMVDALSSPSNALYSLVRLYAGRKMPPGTGRKVDLSVPKYAAGGLVNYDPNEIDTIVSQLKEEFHG
jgi:hypothetical protein